MLVGGRRRQAADPHVLLEGVRRVEPPMSTNEIQKVVLVVMRVAWAGALRGVVWAAEHVGR